MAMPAPLTIAAAAAPRTGGFLAEERIVEKRRLDSSSPSVCWDCRLGKNSRGSLYIGRRIGKTLIDKAGRNVRVLAAGSAVSNTSGTQSTSYLVKEGDTLTSIAKKSNTTVRLLADANKIEDVNFLLSGQLLHIPSKSSGYDLPDEFPSPRKYDWKSEPKKSASQQEDSTDGMAVKGLSSNGAAEGVESKQLAASVRPAPALYFPRLAVPLLLMAPLLGFCVRCVFDSLYVDVDLEEARQRAEKDTWEILHRPKAKRWQKILDEDRDGLEPEASSTEESTTSTTTNAWTGGDVWSPDEDAAVPVLEKPQIEESVKLEKSITIETDEEIGLRHKQDYEDIRKSYAELESSYVKFLADSGMSKSGYWRGSGVPTAAQFDDGEST